MGSTKSKTVIEVPVNSVHEGSTDFVSHHVHSGTLKMAIGAFLIMFVVMALFYLLCKKFLAHHRMSGQNIPDLELVRYVDQRPTREVLPKLA